MSRTVPIFCVPIFCYLLDYLFKGFLRKPSIIAPITEPITSATKYHIGWPITGSTKIPPCGALRVHPKNMERAPATAEPTTHEGITLAGSDAAKGMAPSVMNDKPIT